MMMMFWWGGSIPTYSLSYTLPTMVKNLVSDNVLLHNLLLHQSTTREMGIREVY
jgi:hypothetical protein